MNEFYAHTNAFIPGTKVKADEANGKFDGIERAFDKLPTEQQLKSGNLNYAVATGTANNYAVALPYPPDAYFDGLTLNFKGNIANTGSSVINVNGLGNKTIVLPDGSALGAGDVPAGGVISLVYGGGSFQFQGASLSKTILAIAKAAEAAASATSSAASATTSATSATSSATSATSSATSATNSATSATNSAASATNSATSATSSAASATASQYWANQAAIAAAGAVIDDAQTNAYKTWSSNKIVAALQTQQTTVDAALQTQQTTVVAALQTQQTTVDAALQTQQATVDTALRVPTAATLNYTAGVLTSIVEAQVEGTKTTTLTYTAGDLTSLVTVLNNYTKTDTLTYTAGVLTSTTTSEVYA
jgi:hypothetical protein